MPRAKVHVDRRTSKPIESFCSPLLPYLGPEQEVLDVGCGPGDISIGIAWRVASVIGVDLNQDRIDEARSLAMGEGITNADFQRGDAENLEFPEDRFDLTFSSALLGWMRNPVRCLGEQRRVTRPGGSVAARCGSWSMEKRYPACPSFGAAMVALFETYDWEDHFYHSSVFLRLHELFGEAGLLDIRIEVFTPPLGCVYPGSAGFEERYAMAKRILARSEPHRRRFDELVTRGALAPGLLEQAEAENETWHRHPHAFAMAPSIFAVGRAP